MSRGLIIGKSEAVSMRQPRFVLIDRLKQLFSTHGFR
jgi:hypothetical protein